VTILQPLSGLVREIVASHSNVKAMDYVDHSFEVTAWGSAPRGVRLNTIASIVIRIQGDNLHSPVFENFGM
jgi:hypothetical protein